MDIDISETLSWDRLHALLEPVLVAVRDVAAELDREHAFPAAALEGLRSAGALLAPLPLSLGGLGLGTEPPAAPRILDLLRRIGHGSLALGRVYEGHVNALRLVMRYGTQAQARQVARDAHDGHLFALWIAEPANAPVRVAAGKLFGSKRFASAAGVATRTLITAERPEGGSQMLLLSLRAGQAVEGPPLDLQGMRSARTGSVRLDGIVVAADQFVGLPGDYMRQPEISLGAWRTLAVLLGGLEALVEELQRELAARGRAGNPHQLARMGHALVARETARLWLEHVATLAEAADAGEDAANYVKLARLAVERCCVEAIGLAQRSAGLAAFLQPHPIERLCRDLGTYLRQPALDEVLAEAAAHFTASTPP
jgi:alkylation response protein AidB-like acyl-CoA dehydrogenase